MSKIPAQPDFLGSNVSPLQNLLGRLDKVSGTNGKYTALCPAHDDRKPSLSITDAGNKLLMRCCAGCPTEDVMTAVGLELKDLFYETTRTPVKKAEPDHEAVALKCAKRWEQAQPADPRHPYLVAKGIEGAGARQEGVNLLLPMQDKAGHLWDLQTIAPDGVKLFAKGGKAKGVFMPLPGDDHVCVVCEGYATGVSINKATGYRTLVSFSCSNMANVARMEREASPDADIVIAGDRTPKDSQDKARKLTAQVRARLAVPECDGSDFNDMAQEGGDVKVAIDGAGTKTAPVLDWANEYVLTDKEAEEMSNPDWIYENLIIQGHLIVIPAPANGGKTTIMMHLAGEIAADHQVFYVNADVSGGDAKQMVTEAKEMGYTLLLPDMKGGRSMDDVVNEIITMNEVSADYSGVVFIFDTLKKMTDVINKSRSKELYKTLRGLSAKGMTIVLLAHTNKYNDADGKPIFEGTVDLRNDVDEMIYFIPQHHPDGSITVSTDPDKKRGSHVPITFDISADREVSRADEFVDTAAELRAAKDREQDATIIEVVTEALEAGNYKQAEIIDYCHQYHNGVGRRSVERVLRKYSHDPGRLWTRQRAFQNNAWLYELVKSAPPAECTKW